MLVGCVWTKGIIVSIQNRHRTTTCVMGVPWWSWRTQLRCKNSATVDWRLLVGVIVVILAMRLACKRSETTWTPSVFGCLHAVSCDVSSKIFQHWCRFIATVSATEYLTGDARHLFRRVVNATTGKWVQWEKIIDSESPIVETCWLSLCMDFS